MSQQTGPKCSLESDSRSAVPAWSRQLARAVGQAALVTTLAWIAFAAADLLSTRLPETQWAVFFVPLVLAALAAGWGLGRRVSLLWIWTGWLLGAELYIAPSTPGSQWLNATYDLIGASALSTIGAMAMSLARLRSARWLALLPVWLLVVLVAVMQLARMRYV